MSLLRRVVEHPRFDQRESEYLRWYPKTLSSSHNDPAWKASSLRGAYIHIPFCDRICKFCPFNKIVAEDVAVARFVNALRQEIQILSGSIGPGPLSFIYFGGGTPSVLNPNQISSILEEIDMRWGLTGDVEVTLETHPTHARKHRLYASAAAGINRISIGIQSFGGQLLSALGATHEAQDSWKALEDACAVFENVAADLLYRYWPQTIENWHDDLKIVLEEFQIPHLSCYALIPFGGLTTQPQPSQEEEVEFALEALNFGQAHGLHHYASCASGGFDIAKSDRRCRYELEHWRSPQSDFVGLGPGAFGFAGGHSTVNRLGLIGYCNLLEQGRLPLASIVPVSQMELRHRYFVLGVKALEVPFAPYRSLFERDPFQDFADPIEMLEQEGLANVDRDSMRLSPVGRLYVDTCSTLFFSKSQRGVPHPEEPEVRAIERLLPC